MPVPVGVTLKATALQVLVVALFTAGIGFTVTVILYTEPTQPLAVLVGVTLYSTVPGAPEVFDKPARLIVPPEPGVAPVTPLTAPIVQLNVLGTVAASVIEELEPLHIFRVLLFVTAGYGFRAMVTSLKLVLQLLLLLLTVHLNT